MQTQDDYVVKMSPILTGYLSDMSQRLGVSREEILSRAIFLMKRATDADKVQVIDKGSKKAINLIIK